MGEQGRRSNWWYGVAIPAALEFVGWAVLKLMQSFAAGPRQLGRLDALVALYGGGIPVILGWLLLPVFSASLFMDARRLRDGQFGWNPNPYLWASVGLVVPIIGFVLNVSMLKVPIAVAYLYRRWRYGTYVPTVPDESADGDNYGQEYTNRNDHDENNGAETPPATGRITR
ncbi:hypothetical protein [Haladaptatus sp. DFWS20]|uniref:hypothetical protein n=1 Tax=Haladaptatus sp. DFWS20 TaxID=3403467 RepID=UPI003EBDF4DD